MFGASRRMDYELEVGVIVGRPTQRRERIGAKDAGEHIFGFVLVNDWSGEYLTFFFGRGGRGSMSEAACADKMQ